MAIKTNVKLTPELLITAPRRSGATPSPDGKYAFYAVSTYSLDSHGETKEVKVIALETEEVTLFSDDPKVGSVHWLVGNQLLWTKKVDGGRTEIWVGTARTGEKNAYLAGTINSSIGHPRTAELSNGTVAIGFSALVSEDGSLLNAQSIGKPLSSAREYDSVLVRYFDRYFEKERSTLWYTVLEKSQSGLRYTLSKSPLINALESSDYLFPTWPVDALGDDGDFQLSSSGVLFLALDSEVDPAKLISQKLCYVEVMDFTSPPEKIHAVSSGFDGIYTSPIWSGDGKSMAFLSTESLKVPGLFNRIFVIQSFTYDSTLVEIIPVRKEKWDLNPSSLVFSNDGSELYVIAGERARQKLWKLSLDNTAPDASTMDVAPILLSADIGSITAVFPLNRYQDCKKLLVNTTSLVDNGSFTITDTSTKSMKSFAQFAHNDLALGVRRSQVSEIAFKGKGDYNVQAWVFKPSDFDKKKTYPLAFLIHGGPVGTWADAWSTRWNPAVWAEQGYVVVLPNPSGSSSFGLAFQKEVLGNWGGTPYDDLVCCFNCVEKTMPFVDTDRAIAAGGSYGGYMANWIAGKPLGLRFKAIVSHDGIFSNYSMLASDLPIMLLEDLGGEGHQGTWDDAKIKALWDKFDPAQYTKNWKTPMLFIHSDNDFRCPITEGLGAYNVCQLKGIPSRFLNFPDENHFVMKRENSLKWHKTVLGWGGLISMLVWKEWLSLSLR